MPQSFDEKFFRVNPQPRRRAALVIPNNARYANPRLEQFGPNTDPAKGKYAFAYLDFPVASSLLEDNAMYGDDLYEFSFRDAVLGVFDLPLVDTSGFLRGLSSSSQVDVLAALNVGEAMDVPLPSTLSAIHHIQTFQFPCGLPDSGYGGYGFSLNTVLQAPTAFRVLSSYEPCSPRTTSRLPFFVGFRVFGANKDEQRPTWRQYLDQAIRDGLAKQWDHSLLFAAFALESFIDQSLRSALLSSGLGDEYIAHTLTTGERQSELHGLNSANQWGLSKKDVNRLSTALDQDIFTARNALAHGKRSPGAITMEEAARAIRRVVGYVWDYGKSHREHLICPAPWTDPSELIDESLLGQCLQTLRGRP